jgi:hypothetical protein
MKAREITIGRLQITLPRAQSARNQHDGEALAKSVAVSLANSLSSSGLASGRQSLKTLSVRIPGNQADAKGIARAIQTSIGKELARVRKER